MDTHAAAKKPRLAIVGMAGRFPDAADHEKFWNLLEAGLDVHRRIPKDRFDVDKHYDPHGKVRNTSHTPYGCFIEEPGLFDPRFFNMSPREAAQTDPMQRLALSTAYEALEMAGYVPNRTPSTQLDRIGTFYGQTSDDWREINAAQDIDTYFITGGVRPFGPGRINYHFKFSGPSFSIDTACSSSAAAIQLACTSIWANDCDTAVCGGLNVMTNSDIFAGLSRGQFLSKTGNCQTYDNDADGYCRGDGIGTVIIKRLEDAEADNDRILGVILGTATNHSAEAVSITHPHAPTQEVLFKKVMHDAGLDPHDVDYVEMHGTGTQAGDSTEMESVTNVFAPQSRSGTRQRSLHIGSAKANIGHGEAASGVTAFIKSLMMLQKGTIPPHCGIKGTINQGFPKDLDARNVHIAFKPTPFHSKDGSPRRVFVNNFSAAGGNTATLLEEAPLKTTSRDDPRGDWVVAVSAKSKSALRANVQNFIRYVQQHPEVHIADLSYTTTARRIQHNYRIAFSTNNDAHQIVDILNSHLEKEISPVSSAKPKVAFAYTGQGSHYTALGKSLFDHVKSYQEDVQNLDDISKGLGYPSFMPLIQGDDEMGNPVEAKSLSPLVVQLGLTCIQIALTRLWGSLGVNPDMVVGHSLGEYAALNAAGVLSISDTIYLVGERAKLLQEKCTAGSHAMLATKASVSSIEGILKASNGVEIACVNGPQETVVGGSLQDIDDFAERLSMQGIKSTKLRTPFAFHSSQVDPIMADFEQIAGNVTFHKPRIPIVSPLFSTIMDGDNNRVDARYLARHAREPVNFVGGLSFAKQFGLVDGETAWVELGPHPVCLGFVKSNFGSEAVTVPTLRRDVSPFKTMAETLASLHLAGASIDWNQYHSNFQDCVSLIDLPAYAFDNKNYWIQYTGDWNLTKGRVNENAALLEPTSSITTTSVQRIVSEHLDSHKATVTIESDTSQPQLRAAVQGHMVNGTALCPSSLYADMAMTVGRHLHRLANPGNEDVLPEVCDMEVFKPFIVNEDASKSQTLRLSGILEAGANKAILTFSSGSEKAEVQHAKCFVMFGVGNDWAARWQRQNYLIGERIEQLKKLEATGQAHRMLRGMTYRLFGSFVDYDKKYQGMEEVIFDSSNLEATALINFQTQESDGKFYCSPYWIDSVCHLAGFIVNANDTIDFTKQAYVSHGWESMRFSEPLQADKTYRSYVKMQPSNGNMMSGDVYIFDGDRIIGLCDQLKFQSIPRSLLNTFLPPKGASTQKPAAASAPKPNAKAIPAKPSRKAVTHSRSQPKPTVTVTSQILDVIAVEVGVSRDELADSIDFTNLGVDSLMSLTIGGRIREDFEIELEQTVFADYPTVGEFKDYLKRFENSIKVESSSEDEESIVETSDDDGMSSPATTISTPLSTPDSPVNSSNLSTLIRKTISEGMEVDISELISIEDLSTIGMDSLMALTMLGTLREEAGLALPSDFFVENRSINAIEQALHITPPEVSSKKKAQPKKSHASKSTPHTRTSTPQPAPRLSAPKTKKVSLPDRQATSLLLQGSPKTASKQFWLVPDGGGAPMSYTFMDTISPSLAVWGLTSPFVKTPEEFIIGVTGIATKYITEIKRRQPSGPYHLGGWSAGGVISYEIVQQLIALGDEVETLVFIDTPCPLIIEPLPSSIHRFFGSIGLLGDGEGALEKLPPWLLPHFAQSVTALSTYDAAPLPEGKCPNVWAMWCEDGVCKTPEDRRPEPYPYGHAEWLLENRTDFGPNLWDEFVDGGRLRMEHMQGNHFSMMKPPFVGRLVEFLGRALA